MAFVLGPSGGGIRRHVRFLASRPPPGFETLGVWGPADLAPYFAGLGFHTLRGRWRTPSGAHVVHVHGLTAGRLTLGPLRAPVVLTVHTDIETQGRTARSRLLRTLARVVAARADAVIAVSERVALSFPRARIIAPAVEPLPPPSRSREDVRAAMGTPPGRTVVITIARLHRDKGLEGFVTAVGAAGGAVEGWICGEGPERERLGALVGAGGPVRLLGHRDDVADLLGAADVFALTSVGEAYGIAVLEALQAGLPVVVTDVGALREIVADAGLVVPAGDQHAFANALRRLVHEQELRETLGARARARRWPSPEDLVAQTGKVYEEVVR